MLPFVLGEIATLHFLKSSYKESFDCYQELLHLPETLENEKARIYNGIGKCHVVLNQVDKASEVVEQVLELADRIDQPVEVLKETIGIAIKLSNERFLVRARKLLAKSYGKICV